MAKTFKSFVYDLKTLFNPEIINGMCYGKFRLTPEYKDYGAPFGFDWIRTGDAKEYVEVDRPYNMHVGRYYEKDGSIAIDLGTEQSELMFISDKKIFKKLCNSYPISNIKIFPSPNDSQTSYHVPVLSIYPYSGKDRDIAKLILELSIIKSPAKIELIYNTEYFEINGIENISTQKGKCKIKLSIKCIREFAEDEYIRVVSTNSKGKRKNAGILRVCKNMKQLRKELSVLLVNTKILTSDKECAIPLVGNAHEAKSGITYYLRHALMTPQFDTIDLDLGYRDEFRKGLKRVKGNRVLVIKKFVTIDNVTKIDKVFVPIHKVITDQLKQIRNIDNYDTIVYCLGEQLGRLVNREVTLLSGVTIEKCILLKKNYSGATACHETLHTLGLAHTFSNLNFAGNDLSEFVYEKYATDNLMDYLSDKNNRTNLWEWQWKQIRTKGFSEI